MYKKRLINNNLTTSTFMFRFLWQDCHLSPSFFLSLFLTLLSFISSLIHSYFFHLFTSFRSIKNVFFLVTTIMSTTKDNLATTPLPEEEESKPLLTEKPDNSIITSSGKKINGNSRSPNKSSLIKSSLHHRSADNQLDNNGIGDSSKQVLFRTGSHQTGPLSVHYQTKDDDSNNIKVRIDWFQ